MPMISFFTRLFDLISPRACPVCGNRLGVTEETLCLSCNRHLPRTFFWNHPLDNEMAKTFWLQIPVEKAAALFYYEAHAQSSQVIYQMKYGNHPEMGEQMGRMMALEMNSSGFFEGIDFLLPVPLAPVRERQRGYNQSMEIARGIQEVTGIPICHDALRRISFTDSQTQKDRRSRQENVAKAFQLINADKISGKQLLLIDDVVTTGATLIACGQELQKAHPQCLSLLSLGFTH